MAAEAFHSVKFPILPLLIDPARARARLQERNSKLFTPRDFDYSPYFEIIKYPMFDFDELAIYRQLPWCIDEVAVPADLAANHAANLQDDGTGIGAATVKKSRG